jgi:hypothetical protein
MVSGRWDSNKFQASYKLMDEGSENGIKLMSLHGSSSQAVPAAFSGCEASSWRTHWGSFLPWHANPVPVWRYPGCCPSSASACSRFGHLFYHAFIATFGHHWCSAHVTFYALACSHSLSVSSSLCLSGSVAYFLPSVWSAAPPRSSASWHLEVPPNMATRDRNSTAQAVASILNKLNDPDPDIRFMQLSDLTNILNASSSEYFKTDAGSAGRVIEGLLKALADQNGEVQNQALKW